MSAEVPDGYLKNSVCSVVVSMYCLPLNWMHQFGRVVEVSYFSYFREQGESCILQI